MYSKETTLFISNIDKSFTEEDLYNELSKYGVNYVKIIKDINTEQSWGYGYIVFDSNEETESALETWSNKKIGQTCIHLSYLKDKKELSSQAKCNIFVKSIHLSTTKEEFEAWFTPYGKISYSKLIPDKKDKCKLFGVLCYYSVESAKKAITERNNFEWKGSELFVSSFERQRKLDFDYNPKWAVYILDIPKKFKTRDVEKLCSKFGKTWKVWIKEPDESRWHSYLTPEKKEHILSHKAAAVYYKYPSSAVTAINLMPYYKVEDSKYNDTIDTITAYLRHENFPDEYLYPFANYIADNDLTEKALNNDLDLKKYIYDFAMLIKDWKFTPKHPEQRVKCSHAYNNRQPAEKIKMYCNLKEIIQEKKAKRNLFVKNLPRNYTEKQLREWFEPYGSIRNMKLMLNEGISLITENTITCSVITNYGYISYHQDESAEMAIIKWNNYLIDEQKNLRWYVGYFQGKKEREIFEEMLSMSKSFNHATYPRAFIFNEPNEWDIGIEDDDDVFNEDEEENDDEYFIDELCMKNMSSRATANNDSPNERKESALSTNSKHNNIINKESKDDVRSNKWYKLLIDWLMSNVGLLQFKKYFPRIAEHWIMNNEINVDKLLNNNSYFFEEVLSTVEMIIDDCL